MSTASVVTRRVAVASALALFLASVSSLTEARQSVSTQDIDALIVDYRFGDPDRAVAAFAAWDGARVRRESSWRAAGDDPWRLATLALLHEETARSTLTGWRERLLIIDDLFDELYRAAQISGDARLMPLVRDLHLEHGGNGGLELTARRFANDALVELRLGAVRESQMEIVEAGGTAGWSRGGQFVWSNGHGRFSADAARAIDHYRRALDIAPRLVEARTRLGRVLWLTGRRDEAERELQRARTDAIDVPGQAGAGYLADLFLGRLHEHDGNTVGALQSYEAAVARLPQGQAARLALARLALASGAGSAARRAVETSFGPAASLPSVDPWTRYDGQLRGGPEGAARIRALRTQLPGASVVAPQPEVTREPPGIASPAPSTRLAADRLRVSVVVDTSASVPPGETHPGSVVLRAVADAIRPGDVVSVLTFDDRVEVRVPPTKDAAAVRAASPFAFEVRPDTLYRSTVWDATLAAGALTAGDDVPTLVLLVSDGVDNASWNTREETTRALARAGVVVDLIEIVPLHGSYDLPPPGLPWPERLASGTGGETYAFDDVTRIARRIAELRRTAQAR